MRFIEDMSVEERKKYFEERTRANKEQQELVGVFAKKTGDYKYRCEQTVVNKINGIVSSHAETKREFGINLSVENNLLIVKCKMTDNQIVVNPAQLNEVMSLISEVDYIKSNATLRLDPKTGKIGDVINLEQIRKDWHSHKPDIISRYGFLNDPKAEENLQRFFELVDEPLKTKAGFIKDLESKIFFDLFFDKFLVLDNMSVDNNCNHTFYSYLFDQQAFESIIDQSKQQEANGWTRIRRSAEKCETKWKVEDVKERYNQKYKAMIGYEFSDYDFTFRQDILLNEKAMPEEIKVTIVEEVKNNIEIYIDYKLYKIKD